jgi:hypothetical protein
MDAAEIVENEIERQRVNVCVDLFENAFVRRVKRRIDMRMSLGLSFSALPFRLQPA